MKPSRNEMQGDWLNEDNRLVITFDTLPFDDYNIARVVSNEVKKSGKKLKVKDKVFLVVDISYMKISLTNL
ncbi:MAG: hypothetical protein DI539_15905 [Flavobacterium psychrophilum]|nr:MAG: hypothetical protein DI539_15905 [Flavobacterium psychrophilum]